MKQFGTSFVPEPIIETERTEIDGTSPISSCTRTMPAVMNHDSHVMLVGQTHAALLHSWTIA